MGAKAILKPFLKCLSQKGFGPIVDDIEVLFYSINTAHKWIRNSIFKHRLIFQYLILWLPVRKYGQSEVPSSVLNRCHNSLLNYLLWTKPWHKPKQMKPLEPKWKRQKISTQWPSPWKMHRSLFSAVFHRIWLLCIRLFRLRVLLFI